MPTSPFTCIVKSIQADKDSEAPGFDPENGNESARFLFVLEAPGPKAKERRIVSINNNDQTAKNFRQQLKAAGIEQADIAVWNIVPWYLGNLEGTRIRAANSDDIRKGLPYLGRVIKAMPKLQCIVLVGGKARGAHIWLSSFGTAARILSCHHPSPKVLNSDLAAGPENIKIFRRMLRDANSSGTRT